jgi:WD40 repeat protein
LSLSKDRTVRLWDFSQIIKKELAESEVSKTQQTSSGAILSIAYSKQLNSYATGHQNGEISIWHEHTNKILHKLQDHTGYVSKL